MAKVRYGKVTDEMRKLTAPSEISSVRNSLGVENGIDGVRNISIEKLIPFSGQARVFFDAEDITSLANTIKSYGVRTPLTVIRSEEDSGLYEVVSGERRLRACREAGLSKIPCIIISDRKKAEEISIIENIHRANLHPLELAASYKRLLEKGVYDSQQVLAQKLSVSKTSVSELLKFLDISQNIRDYLIKNKIKSRDLLRKIVGIKDEDKVKALLNINPPLSQYPFVQRSSQSPKTIKSASVLRISLSGGEYKIQKKSINILSSEQKEKLKKALLDIVRSI